LIIVSEHNNDVIAFHIMLSQRAAKGREPLPARGTPADLAEPPVQLTLPLACLISRRGTLSVLSLFNLHFMTLTFAGRFGTYRALL
jgi:hypothetical protein